MSKFSDILEKKKRELGGGGTTTAASSGGFGEKLANAQSRLTSPAVAAPAPDPIQQAAQEMAAAEAPRRNSYDIAGQNQRNMWWSSPSAVGNAIGEGAKRLGATALGAAGNFVRSYGQYPLWLAARAMELGGDIQYAITKDERFNLDNPQYNPGGRDSDALRATRYDENGQAADPFSAAAEFGQANTGKLGNKVIDIGSAAGNMMAGAGTFGYLTNAASAAGITPSIVETASSSPLLTPAGTRAAAKIGADLLTNPGNLGVSVSSALSSYDEAIKNGATLDHAVANGILKGGFEYLSNKLFSGTPFEDTGEQAGYVTQLIEHVADRLGKKGTLKAFNESVGGRVANWIFDKTGEGLEEVVTGILDPLADRLTYNPKADLATADQLVDEFLGGVLLSLGMSGGEALIQQGARTLGVGLSDQDVFDSAMTELRENGELSPATQRRLSERPAAQMAYDAAIGNRQATATPSQDGTDTTSVKSAAEAQETAPAATGSQAYLAATAKKAGYSEAATESLLQSAPADAADATAYFDAYNSFYDAGRKGIAYKETQPSETIPAELGRIAYNWGTSDSAVAASQLIGHSDSTAKTPGLLRDDNFKKAKLTTKEARTLDAIGKVGGVEIRLADKIEAELRHVDENGNVTVTKHAANASFSDGVITISLSAKDPIIAAAVHETIHNIKSAAPEAYTSLANFVFNNMSDAFYGANVAVRQEIGYADEDIPEEIVADAFGRMLNDKNLVEQYVHDNRTAAQKIRDTLHDLLVKIKRYLEGNQRTLTADQKLAFVNLQQKADAMLALYDQALKRAGEYKTNGGKKAPADIDPDFAEAKYSVAPPYRDGTADYASFVSALNAEAKKTFDLFASIHDYGDSHLVKMKVGSGKSAHMAAVDITTRFMTASTWNNYCKNNTGFAKAAKDLTALLPDNVRTAARFKADGTMDESPFEKQFKMERSFMQRVVDALPKQVVDPVVVTDGREVRVSNKTAIQAIGGEEYRRALVEERRKLYEEGSLPTRSIGGLHKDSWGAMGFLATNTKTVASGDFTTFCPQMFFNKGCFYCYRRSALETGVNNKLTAESVWYTGEILLLTDEDVNRLNATGGLRIQSFGDWMEQYSGQLADMLIDAEKRHLQIKIITKEPSMIQTVALLRDQDIGKELYFNLSVDNVIEPAGRINNQDGQGALSRNPARPYMNKDGRVWWKRALTVEEAFALRIQYPFVNVRTVALTVDDFVAALKDPHIQVVTGYHGKLRHFERINSQTGEHIGPDDEVIYTPKGKIKNPDIEPVGDNGMPRFVLDDNGKWIVDPEHPGKTSVHKKLAQRILDEGLVWEYYTKACCIFGRCDQCEGKCGKIANNFAVQNATNADVESIAYWQGAMTNYATKNPLLIDQKDGEDYERSFAAWEAKYGKQQDDAIRYSIEQSETGFAPTFYSKLEREIESYKGEKIGASSAISYLKGHGVKDEEIKWSGIATFLEGKKSVSKQELLQWVRDNQLTIDTVTLTEENYTPEEQARLAELLERKLDISMRIMSLWESRFGEPLSPDLLARDHMAPGIQLRFRNRNAKDDTNESRDHLEANQELGNAIKELGDIEAEEDSIMRDAMLRPDKTRWGSYALRGGKDYREFLYTIPGSEYYNEAMKAHWMRAGVLAHARVQDFTAEGEAVLFADEIQSDWHNMGQSSGYNDDATKEAIERLKQEIRDLSYSSEKAPVTYREMTEASSKASDYRDAHFNETMLAVAEAVKNGARPGDGNEEFAALLKEAMSLSGEYERLRADADAKAASFREWEARETERQREIRKRQDKLKRLSNARTAEDAPYRNGKYAEFVVKNLLREAAERGYAFFGWTTGQIQEERWSDAFAEGYRIEYDQDIPSFLKKYGKQWKAAPADIVLDENDYTVHAIRITPEMRQALLYEGQPKYSLIVNGGTYFSGGGLVDYALREVSRSVMAVEKDEKAAAVFKLNNGNVFNGDVNDFTRDELKKYVGKIDWFHASPVCKNYSRMNIRRSVKADSEDGDIPTAEATAETIEVLLPPVFTLEQVPEYNGSKALSIITDKLDELGYTWDITIANAYEYGGATSRERLMLRAVKDGTLPPLPDKVKGYSWYDATYDLFDVLPEVDHINDFPQKRIDNTPGLAEAIKNAKAPLLILQGNASWRARWVEADKPCPSITTDMHDARIIMPDGRVLTATARFFARIMGLPDSYQFTQWRGKDNQSQGYKVVGNGVPVQLTQKFFGNLLADRFDTQKFSISDRDALDRYIAQYGAIDQGEGPRARDNALPKRTKPKTRVSKTARTILEANATPDSVVPSIEKLAAQGEFTYNPYSDKQAIQDADAKIRRIGWKDALSDWYRRVGDGIVSKENTAEGWALYNNAANSGDTAEALRILRLMVRHQRNAAQAVQATRILKKLSPETQLYNIAKSIDEIQREINERYGTKNAPQLQIDQDLADAYLAARTEEERERILQEIYRDVGRQLPSRFIDRWNAWRYLAMLGNPRTHVRNTLGNAGFMPVVLAKDALATGIESAVGFIAQKKGKDFNRTKGNIIGRDGKELLTAAWGDYANIQDEALGEGKYVETKISTSNKYVREGQQEVLFRRTRNKTFNRTFGRAIDALNRFNSNALNVEDVWFSQPHYAIALAQYCKANGITAAQIQSGKGLDAAREYAIKEAQKATYRDINQFSQIVSQLGRGQKYQTNTAGKVLNAAAEGIMPFRKTPANILVRGVEYSPIGLLKSITYDAVQVKKGNMSGAEMIDHLAAGLTGTALVGLGVLLSALGLVRGHGSPDEKKRAAEELAGHQAYSLELGGKSITLDWLAPECLPFFIGVNLAETAKEEKCDIQMKDVLASVTNISEPLLELSCLQGINDLLDNLSYAKNNGINALTAMAASTATSYLTQALPTLAGQAERTTEGKRYTTYTDKNKWLMSDVQYALGKASGKVPVWEYGQIPYIDAWGREDLSGGWLLRAWRNFINPSYVNEVDEGAMEKELVRLYDRTGKGSVLPSRPARYFNVNGERKDLTGEEYVTYATACGQTAYGLVGRLTQSSEYKSLSDDEKAAVVSDAYDYATYTARTLVGGKIPDSEKWVAKAQEGRSEYQINPDTYILLKNTIADITSIKDSNGKSIDNSYGLQVMDTIYNTSGLSDRQRQYLFSCFGVGKNIIGYSRDQVRRKLSGMR